MSNSKETLSPQPTQDCKLIPIVLGIAGIKNAVPCSGSSCVLADLVKKFLENNDISSENICVGWSGYLLERIWYVYRRDQRYFVKYEIQFDDRDLVKRVISHFDSLQQPISWETAINFWAKYRDKPLLLRVPVELLK